MLPTVVSIFSGAGGLDIGLERAGWHTAVATDIDPAAVSSLRESQAAGIRISGRDSRKYLDGAKIIEADIRDLTADDLRPAGTGKAWRPDLLAGGPPCQPWSSAGLQLGFKDSRGMLIAQMLRLAAELKPKFVLMENVRGLLTAMGPGGSHGEAIRIIQTEWEKIGYAVSWGLLNAADFGAAQRRVRLVMLGTSDHHMPIFPETTHSQENELERLPWVTLGDLLADMPKPDPRDVIVPSGKRAAELLALEPGTGIRTGGTVEHQRPSGHWGYRQDCFLADLSLPSRTIRAAGTPDWVKPPGQGMRRLTWRECAALQGFPGEWRFEGNREARYRLIGNAVQTDMAYAVGKTLLTTLKKGARNSPPASVPWPDYFTRRIRGAAADHMANVASRRRHRTQTALRHAER